MATTERREVRKHPKGSVELTFHPKSPNASPGALHALAGIFVLNAPIPPEAWKFIGVEESPESETWNAGD